MRAGQLLAGLLAVGVLSGCGSAADVASTDRAQQATPRSDGTTQTSPGPTSGPKTATTPAPPTKSSTSSPPTTSTPTKTTPPAPRRTRQLPNVVGAIPRFLTPSRNIGCAISRGQVRCDIGEHVYRTPRKPSGCQGDYGQSIAVTKQGIAAFICVTDSAIRRRAPVLAYGSSTVVGDFGCTSRTSGIRCFDLKSRHGFWLSQQQPVLF